MALQGVQPAQVNKRCQMLCLLTQPIERQKVELAWSASACLGADGRGYMPSHLNPRNGSPHHDESPSLQMLRTNVNSVTEQVSATAASVKSVLGPHPVLRFYDAVGVGVTNATLSAHAPPGAAVQQPMPHALP